MKLKEKIYIGFTMLLGVELMIILHAFIESWYISLFTATDSLPARNDFRFFSTYLPLWLSALLLLGGLIGGYFLGKCWWHMVYVEKRHWRFRKKRPEKSSK